MEENKNVVRSLRATEADFDKIKQIAEANGINQGDVLTRLIQIYELEGAKEKLPGSADLVYDFQAQIKGLQNTFIYAMDKCYSADDRAEIAVSDKIASKDKIIRNLQAQLEKVLADSKLAYEKLSENEEQYAELLKQIDILKKAKEKAEEALCDKQKLIVSLEEGLSSLRENIDETATIKKENSELKKSLSELKEIKEHIEKEYDNALQKHNMEIENLNSTHKAELLLAEGEKQKAVADTEIKCNLQIAQLNKTYSKKFAELEKRSKEITAFKDQLAKIKTETDLFRHQLNKA